MTVYYLYVKTHTKTDLKYLGQTRRLDPIKYKGSGKIWRNHLVEHGYDDVHTEILLQTTNVSEIEQMGRYYSELWDVANSSEWANMKPETGHGGGLGEEGYKILSEKLKGHPNWLLSQTEESKKRISDGMKKTLSRLTPEEQTIRAKNSFCKPESYTPERSKKISDALIGIKRSDETKQKISIAHKNRTSEQKLACGNSNRGKTWKLINGKRVWLPKENQNY